MPDAVAQGLATLMQVLEIVGAGALALGFVITTVRWVLQALQQGALSALGPYRRALGRVILIGLEVLVAATIIKTIIVDPSVQGVGYLAIIVAIRTILSWTTALEIYDRWPWQRERPHPS
jgi:uncharacterized membrane protein